MAHGTPDWGVTAGAVTTYQLTDLAELAARLGSIVTFDRRGDVLFLEDFADGLVRWNSTLVGTGSLVDLGRARARQGSYSARLVAGSDGTRSAAIYTLQPMPALSAFGLEFSFSVDGTPEAVTWSVTQYTGSLQVIYTVRWNTLTDELEYVNATGTAVAFATAPELTSAGKIFNVAKLVVDSLTHQYVRFLLNANAYDLSGLDAEVWAAGSAPLLQPSTSVKGRSGENDSLYVGHFVLTQNEPT